MSSIDLDPANYSSPGRQASDKDNVTLTLTPTPKDAPPDASPSSSSDADRFDANLRALGLTLPMPTMHFCTARDGSPTAMRDGRWHAGCSVPRRAAEVMLRKETWPGRSLCLLTPTHGQQVAAVLDKLGPTKALVVIFASPDALADALACGDFAAAARAGRLHVACDEPSLRRVFAAHPGLPVPRQMVRLPDADPAAVAAAIAWTQPTLASVTADHAARIRVTATADISMAAEGPPVVLVGRHFGPWADSGNTLARVWAGDGADPNSIDAASIDVDVVDTDRPHHAADAALAERTAAARFVVTADRPRPAWATHAAPWVAWLTRPDIPSFNPAFPRDALLLADDEWLALARTAGWPSSRLAVARWPADTIVVTSGAPLALIAHRADLDPPADIAELSARQVVWEAIREELTTNPFALGEDPARYVDRAPARLNLPPAVDFPTQRFVDGIVGPAFTLGVANWLAKQHIPFTLHGRDWAKEPTLATHDRGPFADRAAFRAAVAASGGVVDPFATCAGHAIRSLGVPVLKTFGRTSQRVLQDVTAIRADRLPVNAVLSPLSRNAIEALIVSAPFDSEHG